MKCLGERFYPLVVFVVKNQRKKSMHFNLLVIQLSLGTLLYKATSVIIWINRSNTNNISVCSKNNIECVSPNYTTLKSFYTHAFCQEHPYVRFVDVLHVLFRPPPSQHALRGLQYIIDKEKRLERHNNRVESEHQHW